MRFGVAIDLHATPTQAAEVSWPRIREQALAAEGLGFDLVVVPTTSPTGQEATATTQPPTRRSGCARA